MCNTKISIRFFDGREVRTVWEEENSGLVSAATQLKLLAGDGKRYITQSSTQVKSQEIRISAYQ